MNKLHNRGLGPDYKTIRQKSNNKNTYDYDEDEGQMIMNKVPKLPSFKGVNHAQNSNTYQMKVDTYNKAQELKKLVSPPAKTDLSRYGNKDYSNKDETKDKIPTIKLYQPVDANRIDDLFNIGNERDATINNALNEVYYTASPGRPIINLSQPERLDHSEIGVQHISIPLDSTSQISCMSTHGSDTFTILSVNNSSKYKIDHKSNGLSRLSPTDTANSTINSFGDDEIECIDLPDRYMSISFYPFSPPLVRVKNVGEYYLCDVYCGRYSKHAYVYNANSIVYLTDTNTRMLVFYSVADILQKVFEQNMNYRYRNVADFQVVSRGVYTEMNAVVALTFEGRVYFDDREGSVRDYESASMWTSVCFNCNGGFFYTCGWNEEHRSIHMVVLNSDFNLVGSVKHSSVSVQSSNSTYLLSSPS